MELLCYGRQIVNETVVDDGRNDECTALCSVELRLWIVFLLLSLCLIVEEAQGKL
jgi:hypothetical protein